MIKLAWCLLVLALACSKREPTAARPPVRVAAASDLTAAFDELARQFERQSGYHVELSFGASGLLTKQLEQGAPFDMFASANVAFVDQLIAKGVCDPATKAPYARGHLVAWSKARTGPGTVEPPHTLADLREPRFRRIALANPETAPYGKAARSALERAGLWSALSERVVYAENIRQTLQFAESGNAEVALVALSLALGQKTGTYFEIDPSLHDPIDQALVVCRQGANQQGGRAFASFVNSEQGRTLMRRYGLLLPGEKLAEAR
ncbi:MAG: Molybdenum transporter, periplasmic molybdenum-binding protein ModA [Myxococcaceae bacterium]|nr:Molybdenum transporter, periplasmic molybdenum-binding protein ModA [Myxococcaceae bacterium]